MPRSKRSRPVTLAAVSKKPAKASAAKTVDALQDHLPSAQYVYVLTLRNPRNVHLTHLRSRLPPSTKLLFGRAKVLAHALGGGKSGAAEPARGTAGLAKFLKNERGGPVGVLFADARPAVVREMFSEFRPAEFASAGETAPRGFVLPAGTVYSYGGAVPTMNDQPAPRTIEPDLRKLGVPVRMEEGRIVLDVEYVVCRERETLGSGQAALLRMFGVQMGEFRADLQACWSRSEETVTDLRQGVEDSGDDWGGLEDDGGIELDG